MLHNVDSFSLTFTVGRSGVQLLTHSYTDDTWGVQRLARGHLVPISICWRFGRSTSTWLTRKSDRDLHNVNIITAWPALMWRSSAVSLCRPSFCSFQTFYSSFKTSSCLPWRFSFDAGRLIVTGTLPPQERPSRRLRAAQLGFPKECNLTKETFVCCFFYLFKYFKVSCIDFVSFHVILPFFFKPGTTSVTLRIPRCHSGLVLLR